MTRHGRRWLAIAWILLALGMLLLAIFAADAPAHASAACPTRAEARAQYPRAHLWWHGSARCWSNSPGRRRAARHGGGRVEPVSPPLVAKLTMLPAPIAQISAPWPPTFDELWNLRIKRP